MASSWSVFRGKIFELSCQGRLQLFPEGREGPFRQEDPEEARSHQRHILGGNGHPPVRVGRGHGVAGTGINKVIFPLFPGSPESGELAGVLDVGQPGLQEVGAEGKQEVGPVDPVRGDAVPAEDGLIGLAQGFVGQRLVEERNARPELGHPMPDEVPLGAGDELTQEDQALASTFFFQLAQPGQEKLFPRLPGDRFPIPPGILSPRPPVSVRMVDPLDGGLSPGAHFAFIHGVQGVSLDFDDPPVAVLGQKAAARRAFPAGGGVPGGLSGDDIFRGDDVGDERARGFGGTTRGCRGSGESEGFQEVPAGEFAHDESLRKIIRKFGQKSSSFFQEFFPPAIFL
jgi:hypothetical protein